ncbi:hypothetical protein BDZ94DRAFT_1316018 [Collybia nuda]|uniref:Fungal-type protein kinase domain-containing protein n=1 Tax=Collybia nuda TaxID=64659 RepID=A0A9P5XRM5_9AGAR|nr:hypothetical protein BDZ94DRAFT_1316018 [Collybia nuda]
MTHIIYGYSFDASTRPRPPDTAPRQSRTNHFTGSQTKALEVEKMVKNDISDGSLYLAKTEDLLTRLFPVDASIIDRVYRKLVDDGTYDIGTKKWSGLPETAKKESSYYQPFVKTAESIRKANTSPNEVKLSCTWIDRHSKAPKSRDQYASIIRPDILCILDMKKEEHEKLDALTKSMEDEEDRGGKVKGVDTGEAEAKKNKQRKEMAAWWLRVNVPIEIKPVMAKSTLEHVNQLLGYMRQVFREQADRRFVPGLLLSRTGLQIWFCDRSGALGTQTMIDIHKNPKIFIRVILGCSLLPPERLGWDPTMKLCRQPVNPQCPESVHSYDPSVRLSDYHNSLYESNWIIEMPSKTDPMKREEYITVRALSIVKAECMSGRATIVWAVIKVDDMKTKEPPHHIYVLKQCWRPTAGSNEGDFFPEESQTRDIHLGRMHSYEDVSHDGNVIDTQNFVRQGLDHFLPTDDAYTNQKRTAEALETAERKEAYLDLVFTGDGPRVVASTRDSNPTWRIFARTLSKDYGWSFKNFRDVLELLNGSEHVIITHEYLYFHGILHRDISSGNVLICPSFTDGVMTTEGRLIDLDYAKRTKCFVPPLLFDVKRNDNKPSNDPTKMESYRGAFQLLLREQAADDDVINAWASNVGSFSVLIPRVLSYNPSLDESTMTAYDIGLLKESQNLPDFSTRVAQNRQRSATLPYASSEILSGTPMFDTTKTTVVHDAVHDLEALFWVLVSICITRGGPGGRRREELKPGTPSTPETQKLFLLVDCFFYTENISRLVGNKRTLFIQDEFEKYFLPHVHPYFERLKPLLVRWWKILQIAYRFPHFETIHGWFLDALRLSISALKENPPEVHPASADVDAFRREDLRSLQYFPNQRSASRESQDTTWDTSPGRDMLSHTLGNYRSGEMEQMPPGKPPPPQDPQTPTPEPKKKRQKMKK